MRILVTSSGRSGSWHVRGEQLGTAIGARVRHEASLEEMRASDVVIVVKRVKPHVMERLRVCGRPVIWDCVDWYKQPNDDSRERLIENTMVYAAAIGATAWIGATRRMAYDIGTPHFLPHHGRRSSKTPFIRKDVAAVGYEGSPRYIERLRPGIEAECAKRGWSFRINPPSLADLDIVLAMRDPKWTCYASKHWKSGIKLSNAQINGIPFVGNRERGYIEQASGAEQWADSVDELGEAFDRLTPYENRLVASTAMLPCAPIVQRVAEEYRGIINEVVRCGS